MGGRAPLAEKTYRSHEQANAQKRERADEHVAKHLGSPQGIFTNREFFGIKHDGGMMRSIYQFGNSYFRNRKATDPLGGFCFA